MNLQIIKAYNGQPEYVLLPMAIYLKLQKMIDQTLENSEDNYVVFDPKDYIQNPVALLRIQANMTQTDLANKLKVSQAYISKIESQDHVSSKTLAKITKIFEKLSPPKPHSRKHPISINESML